MSRSAGQVASVNVRFATAENLFLYLLSNNRCSGCTTAIFYEVSMMMLKGPRYISNSSIVSVFPSKVSRSGGECGVRV